jgi:hypothetical protein
MDATATATGAAQSLAHLGDVPLSYRHEWRVAMPRAPIVLPNAVFKWYHVHREGVLVSAELDELARATLVEAAAQGRWGMEYGLNVALLHVSITHAYLIAGVWRGHNELWERIYGKELGSEAPFFRITAGGEEGPAACVWEFGVICHERVAWINYLFSDRSAGARQAWLADVYAGRV